MTIPGLLPGTGSIFKETSGDMFGPVYGSAADLSLENCGYCLLRQSADQRVRFLHRTAHDCEDGDVVVLSESICCLGNVFGGEQGEICGAFKAIESTGLVTSFGYSVGDERELQFRRQLKRTLLVACVGRNAEREPVFDSNFFSCQVGRNVSSVGNGKCAVCIDPRYAKDNSVRIALARLVTLD